jgi:hypothetical protein
VITVTFRFSKWGSGCCLFDLIATLTQLSLGQTIICFVDVVVLTRTKEQLCRKFDFSSPREPPPSFCLIAIAFCRKH